ncbi:hypothetical protein N7456_008872 [Penicillium angulare]|uniref:Uncharacterized protein n=1 Tax=Penicillium angulare TaxID=116970 RepID=A0A9W9F3W9_9EURO|nr:hypothetical protein N7456_008872 [Penicillium angulare]
MKPTRSDLDRIKKDNDNPHICAICSRPTPTWVEFYNCVVNHCEIPSNETDNSENINPSVPELAPVPSISEELKVDSAQNFKSSFGSTHLWKMSPSAVARTNAEPNLQEWETMGDTHDTLLEVANEDSPSSPCLSKTHIFDQTENSSNQPQLQREEAENINSAEAFELDPVLDADAYYAKLESFEVKTADICDLSNGPTIMTITSLKEAMSARDQTRHAFEYLRSEGFCGDTISIVTEDVHIPDVAHCIRLSLDDIFWTSEQFLPSPAAAPLRERCFQADLGSTSTELILLSMYRLLTAIVKIGLLSFSGSHVCRFDQNLWGKEMDEIHVGAGLSFRPRELACLKGFIGGPVWVLGDSGNRLQQKPLRLSMMVEDIQELWGPAWLVGRSPEEGKAIRTERGYIVPLQPEKKGKGKAEEYSLPIDVECHWSNKLETPLQTEELALLSSTSRILIGTDKDASVGLVFNPRCQSSVQRRQKHVANNCTIPGACEAFFSFEDREFQIGFQSQHGPVANMTWLHKRHPMKSMKETIISGFTSNTIDDRKFLGILKLRIGLEISACTGNAQRITLWDALRLSRTDMGLPPNLKCKHAVGDLVCIKSCWTQLAKPGFLKSKSSINDQMTEDEARQMLVDSILSLRYTGINQKGNLEAYWPFVEVPTNHHILSTKFNRWFDIIHDTTRAATFAVFSQRCLEFRGGGTDGICSKLAQNIDLQSRQTCFCSQVLPRAEPPSKFRFLRSPMSSSSVPLLSPLQGVQLGGMFRVWKMSLVLERIWKGEEEAVVASASNGPLSLMSPRGIPDFEEVINSEFGLSQTVPVVICSN